MGMRFMRFPGGKAKALTFSYDDGVHPDRRLMSIFDKYSMKATFNIDAGLFVPEGTVYPPDSVTGRLPESEVYELYANTPHEVAIHGYTHQYMTEIPTLQMVAEIIDDRNALEKLFGKRITGGAYPFGVFNDDVVEALRLCGIKYCRKTISTENFEIPKDWLRLPATCHHKNPRLMELADAFLEHGIDRHPRLFYLWGHSYEFNAVDNWDVIEKFAERMGGRDDVWYATNIEIYDYIQAYNSMQVSADGKIYKNISSQTLYFICDGKDYMIKSGETLVIE